MGNTCVPLECPPLTSAVRMSFLRHHPECFHDLQNDNEAIASNQDLGYVKEAFIRISPRRTSSGATKDLENNLQWPWVI